MSFARGDRSDSSDWFYLHKLLSDFMYCSTRMFSRLSRFPSTRYKRETMSLTNERACGPTPACCDAAKRNEIATQFMCGHATSGLGCVSSLETHAPNASDSWSTSAGQFSFSWRSPSLRSFLSTTEAHTHTQECVSDISHASSAQSNHTSGAFLQGAREGKRTLNVVDATRLVVVEDVGGGIDALLGGTHKAHLLYCR